jgi:hypothetical protein
MTYGAAPQGVTNSSFSDALYVGSRVLGDSRPRLKHLAISRHGGHKVAVNTLISLLPEAALLYWFIELPSER